MKIASEAQRQMFERCASDPAYARERGISAETAQQFLDAHGRAGSPKLLDRAGAAMRPASKSPAPAPELLQSRRND